MAALPHEGGNAGIDQNADEDERETDSLLSSAQLPAISATFLAEAAILLLNAKSSRTKLVIRHLKKGTLRLQVCLSQVL